MPKLSRISIAKDDILKHFQDARQRAFTRAEIATILRENRGFWRLALHTTTAEFLSFLEDYGQLKVVDLHSETYRQTLTRYVWGDASIYDIALSLRQNGYFSHGTAVTLHGLTNLIPKTLYLNVEQSPKPKMRSSLSQASLDRAFSNKQRQSNLSYAFDDWKVTILSGKNTGRLSVEEIGGPNSESLPTTNLERTLIDIVVRPSYAGGVFQVAEAFRAAKDRVSTNRLVATLRKLDYLYPYHQSIGFLMQRAGYEESRYALLADLGVKFDFYLVHAMRDRDYDPQWKLFFPKGL